MKKIVVILLSSMLFAGVVSANYGTFEGFNIIRVQSNGQTLATEDVPAVNLNGRTMVPIYMLKQFGMDVQWDGETNTVNVISSSDAEFDPGTIFDRVGRDFLIDMAYKVDNAGNKTIEYLFNFDFGDARYEEKFDATINFAVNAGATKVYCEDKNGESYYINAIDWRLFRTGAITVDQLNNRKETVNTGKTPVKDSNQSKESTSLTAKEIAQLRDRVGYIEAYDYYGHTVATGSGFVLQNGLLITNSHVAAGSNGMMIKLDGVTYDNKGWAWFDNPFSDIFGVYLSSSYSGDGMPTGVAPSKYLEYDTTLPEVGEKVYTIGSPMGLENTVSEGIVSGVRTINGIDYIQHTAIIESGSSGGVLLNEQGIAIGVNTWKVIDSDLYFAVPMKYVQDEIDKLYN